jgi:hypothetical protein
MMQHKTETDEEKRRRIAIFLMLKRRDEQEQTPPRVTTLRQEHDLWKTRQARKEARNAERHQVD